jgi:hypothetical protein
MAASPAPCESSVVIFVAPARVLFTSLSTPLPSPSRNSPYVAIPSSAAASTRTVVPTAARFHLPPNVTELTYSSSFRVGFSQSMNPRVLPALSRTVSLLEQRLGPTWKAGPKPTGDVGAGGDVSCAAVGEGFGDVVARALADGEGGADGNGVGLLVALADGEGDDCAAGLPLVQPATSASPTTATTIPLRMRSPPSPVTAQHGPRTPPAWVIGAVRRSLGTVAAWLSGGS